MVYTYILVVKPISRVKCPDRDILTVKPISGLKCPDRDILVIKPISSLKCPDRDILDYKMSRSGHFCLKMSLFLLKCPDRDISVTKCPEPPQYLTANGAADYM